MSVLRIDSNFVGALNGGHSVNIDKQGNWYVEGRFMRLVRWIFGLDESRLRNVSTAITKLFDEMERQAGESEPTFEAAKTVNCALKTHYGSSSNAKDARFALKRRIIAYDYRTRLHDPTESPEEKTIEQVKIIAEQWKAKQPIFNIDKTLHPLDLEKVNAICHYKSFAKLLLKDKKLQEEVFGWTIRTCNPVDALIQFPDRCRRIKECLLTGRIGRFAYENVLSVQRNHNGKKVLTLPFEGKKISILDESAEVSFSNVNGTSYTTTIKDIFEDMKAKNARQGNFEFIGAAGFRNWNCADWSYLQNDNVPTPVTFDFDDLAHSDDWWNHPALPIFEEISADEVERIYGVRPNDNEWVIMAMATRQSNELLIDDCHGYEQVLIPNGDGTFRIHVFGKYAEEWPTAFLQRLGFLANTTRAKFFYGDPSPSYSGFRQQAAAPFVVSDEKGREEMQRIRTYAERAKSGNSVFMFPWENCAYFPQVGLEELLGKKAEGGVVPNLFLKRLLDASASKPLNYCFDMTNACSDRFQKVVVRAFERLFGARRGIEVIEDGQPVFKSTQTSPFHTGFKFNKDDNNEPLKTQYVYLPSYLHYQLLDKVEGIPGKIWIGHQHVQRINASSLE